MDRPNRKQRLRRWVWRFFFSRRRCNRRSIFRIPIARDNKHRERCRANNKRIFVFGTLSCIANVLCFRYCHRDNEWNRRLDKCTMYRRFYGEERILFDKRQDLVFLLPESLSFGESLRPPRAIRSSCPDWKTNENLFKAHFSESFRNKFFPWKFSNLE